MNINAISFQRQLPSVLNAIAGAHFVAIDLELSGIPGQQTRKPRPVGEGSSGKPSLQERYEETKLAAETYQILQLGITCVEEDMDRGVYIARPYNVFVNPVTSERLGIDRNFSYQSGAVEFLLSHGFRMEAPFLEGVPYLSREEELDARKKAAAKQNKSGFADLQIANDDTESLEFIERIRAEIDAWKNSKSPDKPAFLNIAPVGTTSPQSPDRGLNNFQKRLVHQFVRAEHPELVTFGRGGFIQIVPYNKEADDKLEKSRKAAFEDRLNRSVGLRWLVEAMVGGDLSAVESYNFIKEEKSGSEAKQGKFGAEAKRETPESKPKQQYEGLNERLKTKKTILVGHNVFIDLIYFYEIFLGKLPEKVEDFEHRMHEVFPVIIDTKYLATQNSEKPSHTRSSLEELDEDLAKVGPAPTIEIHPEHGNYLDRKPSHEAGFDSFLTAKVLIRLAAKLEAAKKAAEKEADHGSDEDSDMLTEDGAVSLVAPIPGDENSPLEDQSVESETSSEGVSLNPQAPPKKKLKTKARISVHRPARAGQANPAFSHATMFDLLGHIPADDSLRSPGKRVRPQPRSSRPPPRQRYTMMPAFESEFWEVYSNRLRVNGTVEGILSFAPPESD